MSPQCTTHVGGEQPSSHKPTQTYTDRTDSITSTADTEGNKEITLKKVNPPRLIRINRELINNDFFVCCGLVVFLARVSSVSFT